MYNKKITPNKLQKDQNGFIHILLLLYWAILVIWQNIGEYTARSNADVVVKIFLLAMLVVGYFLGVKRHKNNGVAAFLLIVFAVSQFITFSAEKSGGLSLYVAYVFPVLFLFLSFVYGNKHTVSNNQYVTFLHGIIAIVAYAAVYAIIFKKEQFLSAFSITSAYGNELSSFFISSHEYGMYLVGGIISCVVCLELKKKEALSKKIVYYLCLVLFIPNLILTFSRTSMLGLIGFFFLFLLLFGKSKTKNIFVLLAFAFAFALLASEEVRNFFLNIVLKNNNMAGRDELYELSVYYFKSGTVLQRLFGRGITESRAYFEFYTSHGSIHNAYLQVLIYYGVVGLAFMIGFVVSRLVAAIKLIKVSRFVGALSVALIITCILLMLTNTAIIFNSPIDSFFLTVFMVIMPKYLENNVYFNNSEEL